MTETDQAKHERHVETITEAASSLLDRWGPEGVQPHSIAEGLVKAAAVTLLRAGCTLNEAADVLDEIADGMRTLDPQDFEPERLQ